jgi:tripartite-type tricarboxylate transporter receptor subunit TctC
MRLTTFRHEDDAAPRNVLERGPVPGTTTPAEFHGLIRADSARWAKLIEESGIVVEGAK